MKKKDVVKIIITVICVFVFFVGILCFNPKYYMVSTGLYNQGTEEDQRNVVTALGEVDTEERFNTYFKWYNVVHELGHGLLMYNKGVKLDIADEEQLVNDFAVAYWKKYGDENKVNELEDIANYAVEHIGSNYLDGVDYMELAKKNSNHKSFKSSFFNFNDYGWFQFSCVKKSFEANKDLETVLKEMGFENFEIKDNKKLSYDTINDEVSTQIINDAIDNFHDWKLKFPKAIHKFDKDPNNNYSRPVIKILGLVEYPDLIRMFLY